MMTETMAAYHGDDESGLHILAQRMGEDRNYMAWVLAAYRRQEGLSEERLRERLGADADAWLRLSLCRRPQADAETFARQVQQIAAYTALDATALAVLIRQVDVFERFAERTVQTADDAAPGWNPQAQIAAARDRLREQGPVYKASQPLDAAQHEPSQSPASAPQTTPAKRTPGETQPPPKDERYHEPPDSPMAEQ